MTVMIETNQHGRSASNAASGGGPRPAESTRFRPTERLITLSDPTGEAAEAIRSLRTYIMAQHVEKGRRALAICEPGAGAGCSFVAANLAVALAQVGVNTLLLEADLRRPSLDKFIRPTEPAPGLRRYLTSPDVQLSDVIQSEVLPRLSVLYAGSRPQENDSAVQELLAGAPFRDLMTDCLREFDATIIDTPPANRCSDASRVSNIAGYALVVARRDVTLMNDVKTLVSELEANEAKVVGTVLTAP